MEYLDIEYNTTRDFVMSDEMVEKIINQFISKEEEQVELPPCFNYKIYDEEYYQENFPGFDKTVYKILSESSQGDKIVDMRDDVLKCIKKDEEIII